MWMLVIQIKLLVVHTKDLMCVWYMVYGCVYLFVQVCMNVMGAWVRCGRQVSSSSFHLTFGNKKQETGDLTK